MLCPFLNTASDFTKVLTVILSEALELILGQSHLRTPTSAHLTATFRASYNYYILKVDLPRSMSSCFFFSSSNSVDMVRFFSSVSLEVPSFLQELAPSFRRGVNLL